MSRAPTTKQQIKALLAERDRLEAAALEAEAAAIRLALEEGEWFVARAAALLGWKQQKLDGLLQPNRRHASIGFDVRERRKATGYIGGNPNLPRREE